MIFSIKHRKNVERVGKIAAALVVLSMILFTVVPLL